MFSSDHLELHFVDRGGDILLITFNEMGMRADGNRFWGDQLAHNLNLSVAGFVTREPNWFPAAEMAQAFAVLRPISLRFQQRVCYGLSQGGYACLKFAQQADATVVLAFSPQASINPDDIDDERFRQHFRPHLHTGMLVAEIDLMVTRHVIYDPRDELDRRHVELIASRMLITALPLPFIGHSSAVSFARSTTMSALIDAAIRQDTATIWAVCIGARRRSPARAFLISHTIASRWPRIALRIFARYRELQPNNSWWLVARLLALEGLGDAVIDWIKQTASEQPLNAEIAACTAMVAIELRQRETAVHYASAAMALEPSHPTWTWVLERAAELHVPEDPAS